MPHDELPIVIQRLLNCGPHALDVEHKARQAMMLRNHSEEMGQQLDRVLFSEQERLHRSLGEARKTIDGMEEVTEQLTAPPLFPAIFRRLIQREEGTQAEVVHNGQRRVVNLPLDAPSDFVAAGEEVLLSNQLNIIVCKSPLGVPIFGEIAQFDRRLPDGRLVLRCRDEELIAQPAAALEGVELKSGAAVRWDRQAWLAYETIDRPQDGDRFLLEQIENVPATSVGGQDAHRDRLIDLLSAWFLDPDLAARYGLDGRRSCLMIGPPGCGKTLMARVAASEISRLSGQTCSFGVVKPGQWDSPFVGETEMNIRSTFEALREAASRGPAILFLDEIETIGRIRGGMANHHSDRFLGALLAEINGFEDRANLAIVAATNRKDLMDPALLERLGEVEIPVGRPTMAGAEDVFGIHLPSDLPICSDELSEDEARREFVETAVSMIYAPNANNELCVLHFRDNSTRTITARELISGRMIRHICSQACLRAYLRDLRDGERGLRLDDVQHATSEAIARMASTLSPRNAHTYLPDLPRDADVVDVRPVERKVDKPYRYIDMTAA
jgi:proteasome-associated ATPase